MVDAYGLRTYGIHVHTSVRVRTPDDPVDPDDLKSPDADRAAGKSLKEYRTVSI